MRSYSLSHLSDRDLMEGLTTLVARDRVTTAELLAHINEVEVRRLFAPAGCDSMHVYCVERLGLSEDVAFKRINVARAAREFPLLFEAVADGRLNLSGVLLIATHLTPQNAEELIAATAHQSNARIRELIAQRFPQSEEMPLVQSLPAPAAPPDEQLAVRQVQNETAAPVTTANGPHAARQVPPGRQMTPRALQRYAVQFMIDQSVSDKVEYARALMSHQAPSGDLAQVFDRALDALIEQLEKRKLGAASKSRRARRASGSGRNVPTQVRRAVWERDQGRCTFVSDDGHRCGSRSFLEFDHVEPVSRGGEATVENIRLRCRTHNQLEAERVFGAGFMEEKRQTSRRAAGARRQGAARESRSAEAQVTVASAATPVVAQAEPAHAPTDEHTRDILAGLRQLGVRADMARRAAQVAATLRDATLEERMKAALRVLGPKPRSQGVPTNIPATP